MSYDSTFSKKHCKFPKDKSAARVEVAKDVIKWLRAGVYTPASSSGYVVPKSGECFIDEKLLPSFKSIASNCYVCAKGAILLSTFRKFDGKAFREIINDDANDVGYDSIRKQLQGLFAPQQLHDMESAFEAPTYEVYGEPGTPEWFGSHYPDDHDRLLAIMQNVADHEGTFTPSVLYDIIEK